MLLLLTRLLSVSGCKRNSCSTVSTHSIFNHCFIYQFILFVFTVFYFRKTTKKKYFSVYSFYYFVPCCAAIYVQNFASAAVVMKVLHK